VGFAYHEIRKLGKGEEKVQREEEFESSGPKKRGSHRACSRGTSLGKKRKGREERARDKREGNPRVGHLTPKMDCEGTKP